MINDLNPAEKYAPLTDVRLSLIADALRDVRNHTLTLFDPLGGDDAWCHGCRVYSRSRNRIILLSQQHTWLTILEEDAELQFTFAIEGIPVRFYRGSPAKPPAHYLVTTHGELAQRQLFPHRNLDRILRIAVETDSEGRVSTVKLVELDSAGEATGVYVIPHDLSETPSATSIEAKPVHVGPVELEPVQKEVPTHERQIEQPETKAKNAK